MTITSAEQYGIELLNRARLDPSAEAARYGIRLGAGIPEGEINARQKQVLTANDHLVTSAQRHSNWMLDTDSFSHTGRGGSNPDYRMQQAGYSFTGNWSWGENLAYAAFSDGKGVAWAVGYHHRQLMRSDGHRENIMRDSFREVGYSQEVGGFRGDKGSMLTENFAHRGTHVFVTGVAYHDRDNDNFYSIGEGRGGVTFETGSTRDVSASAGGYGLRVASPGSEVTVRITDGSNTSRVIVDMDDRFRADPKNGHVNVKLDLVDGDTVFASSSLTLVSGPVAHARLLGINAFQLTGNDADNGLIGNRGNNRIVGEGGNDRLTGMKGNDVLQGNAGDDRLSGGDGRDRLTGGQGNDALTGGKGADAFIFAPGHGTDRINDFRAGQGDLLILDDALWGGGLGDRQVVDQFARVMNGDIVLDFGDGDVITLANFTDLAALASRLDVI